MRRISDLMGQTKVLEQLTKEQYQEPAFEELNKEAEDRILRLAMGKIHTNPSEPVIKLEKKKRKKHRIFSGKKLALAILVAALVGSVTVSAREGEGIEKVMEVIRSFRLKDSLADQIGMEAGTEVEGIIANDIVPGEKTQTEYGGVSVTVEQIASDGEDAYVYFSVVLPESLVPEQEEGVKTSLLFQTCEVQLGEGEPVKTGFYIRQDAEGQNYGIVNIPLEEVEEASYEVIMTLKDIVYLVYAELIPTRETLLEGTWEMKWPLDCKKTAETFAFSEVIDAHDGIVTTEEVILTPLSVRVEGTIDCDDPTYSQVSAFIDGVILKGDVIEEYDGTWSRAIDGKYTMKGSFLRVIPVEEIIGITVNGKPLYFDKAETPVESVVVPEN